MTKSTITRERIEQIVYFRRTLSLPPSHDEIEELARMALDAIDSEPVAWDYEWASCITCEGPQDFKRIIEREAPPEWAIEEGQARNIIPLYRHAQPATVVPDEMTIRDACKFVQDMRLFDDVSVIVMRTWNACRAAMLAAAPQEVK